jgi:hypothetical protein
LQGDVTDNCLKSSYPDKRFSLKQSALGQGLRHDGRRIPRPFLMHISRKS